MRLMLYPILGALLLSGCPTSTTPCDEGCGPSRTCCRAQCANTANDPHNCGACGTECSGDTYCTGGHCVARPCNTTSCTGGALCCDTQCCTAGQLCCDPQGPLSTGPTCTDPSPQGTCPMGCAPLCVCASPDTPIATPLGEREIASLVVGDLVYSAQDGAVVVVPIVQVGRMPAFDHHVMRVTLASGATLEISPGHPTADGRVFGQLEAGAQLDGAAITSATLMPYQHAFTYDILPGSASGTYYAGGVLIGSTLRP